MSCNPRSGRGPLPRLNPESYSYGLGRKARAMNRRRACVDTEQKRKHGTDNQFGAHGKRYENQLVPSVKIRVSEIINPSDSNAPLRTKPAKSFIRQVHDFPAEELKSFRRKRFSKEIRVVVLGI